MRREAKAVEHRNGRIPGRSSFRDAVLPAGDRRSAGQGVHERRLAVIDVPRQGNHDLRSRALKGGGGGTVVNFDSAQSARIGTGQHMCDGVRWQGGAALLNALSLAMLVAAGALSAAIGGTENSPQTATWVAAGLVAQTFLSARPGRPPGLLDAEEHWQASCQCHRKGIVVTDPVRLTQLAKRAGCAAKQPPGYLLSLLNALPPITDRNVLVGNAAADDAAVYK